MTYDLKTQLKKCKAIEPDAAFVARSRRMLFARRSPRVFAWRPAFFVPAFAAFLVFLGAVLQYFSQPLTVSAFDKQNITQEFNATVGTSLQEISNTQVINQTISSAITEISDTRAPHLSTTLLETEAQNINLDAGSSTPAEDVDSLLGQVLE